MSTGRRLAILGVLIAIAVAAFVIVNPGGDDNNDKGSSSTNGAPATGGATAGATAAQQQRPTFKVIRIKNGKPVGGVQKITVSKGDRVRFVVRSDVSDEVHVHGYDFMKDVKAGGQIRFNFPADIDGNFEIELENAKQQIAALQVQP
jgi:plastocyanin